MRFNVRIFVLGAATLFLLATLYWNQRDTRIAWPTSPIKVNVIGRNGDKSQSGDQKLITETCTVPKLDINGPDVIHFFHDPEPLKCSGEKNWLYIDERKRARLIEERKSARCEVQSITMATDELEVYGEWQELTIGSELPFDISNVRCRDGWWSKWEQAFASVTETEKKRSAGKSGAEKKLSVLVLSFDSLSQMTFRRKLPKTVAYLEKEMEAVILNGYNIVGDGTPQAFIPILTAKTEEELPLTRKRYDTAAYVDDVYPMVWKNFSDAGYVTLYGEDSGGMSTFTYRMKGFRNQPTDHYLRPHARQIERASVPWLLSFFYDGRHEMIQCVGSDAQHEHWLRYAREFLDVYKSTPHFGIIHHSVYSHDDINLVNIMDDDFAVWLEKASKDGLLDTTLLIVMADHGHRFADLRNTHQGQQEERLPFFSFVLPKKLRETDVGRKMYNNLRGNIDRLTTPFDIHRTLLDVIQVPNNDVDSKQSVSSRSLSLFRPIPSTRNCDDAGIPAHFCTCLDWKDAMGNDEDRKTSHEIAEGIVVAMNEQIKDEVSICSPLKLKSIEYSKKLVPKDAVMQYKDVKDEDGFVADLTGKTRASHAHFQLKIATTPGRGVYEATVFFSLSTRSLSIDLSSISHVSQFGDDPHCIIDRNHALASYCVCYDRIR